MTASRPYPALVLLDRDGVINLDCADYVKRPEELVLIPGAAAAIARMNRAGIRLAVCTNQSAVGRGLIDAAMLDRIHDHLRQELARSGASLDLVLSCNDPPDRPTDRRKPGPGMLREALAAFRAEAAATPFIGDNLRDLQAAAAIGCPRVLVRTGHGRDIERRLAAQPAPELLPVAVHDDLAAAVAALLDGEAG